MQQIYILSFFLIYCGLINKFFLIPKQNLIKPIIKNIFLNLSNSLPIYYGKKFYIKNNKSIRNNINNYSYKLSCYFIKNNKFILNDCVPFAHQIKVIFNNCIYNIDINNIIDGKIVLSINNSSFKLKTLIYKTDENKIKIISKISANEQVYNIYYIYNIYLYSRAYNYLHNYNGIEVGDLTNKQIFSIVSNTNNINYYSKNDKIELLSLCSNIKKYTYKIIDFDIKFDKKCQNSIQNALKNAHFCNLMHTIKDFTCNFLNYYSSNSNLFLFNSSNKNANLILKSVANLNKFKNTNFYKNTNKLLDINLEYQYIVLNELYLNSVSLDIVKSKLNDIELLYYIFNNIFGVELHKNYLIIKENLGIIYCKNLEIIIDNNHFKISRENNKIITNFNGINYYNIYRFILNKY